MTLLPVEVRVVDQNGNSVTNLSKSDFTVTENGVVQEIAQFQALSTMSGVDSTRPGRAFMIILGRGQLNAPTKAIEGLIDFLRNKCSPSDRVGVVAYLRAIPLTTAHDTVIAFLESYRVRHEAIDSMVAADQGFRIPAVLSPKTRAAIDALFRAEGLTLDELPGASGTAARLFDNFHYVRNALDYLRAVDGEKNAIIVTEQPFLTPQAIETSPDQNFWAQRAMAARTALWFIHAGGLAGPDNLYRGRIIARKGTDQLESLLGKIQPWDIEDQKHTANLTGGTSSFYQFADQSLDAIDRATRASYLLAYYPRQLESSAASRRIQISVNRPGVTLLYRHGYSLDPPSTNPQDYQRVITVQRMEEAAWRLVYPLRTTGPRGVSWGMRLRPANGTSAVQSVRVAVSFDPTWVMFVERGADRIADLDIKLIADNPERIPVGELTEQLHLNLSPAEFARTKKEWITVELDVPVKSRPVYIRGVLYQYETDRLASSQARIAQ